MRDRYPPTRFTEGSEPLYSRTRSLKKSRVQTAVTYKNSLAALLALSAPEPLPFLPPDVFFPPLFFEVPLACFMTFFFSNPAIGVIPHGTVVGS